MLLCRATLQRARFAPVLRRTPAPRCTSQRKRQRGSRRRRRPFCGLRLTSTRAAPKKSAATVDCADVACCEIRFVRIKYADIVRVFLVYRIEEPVLLARLGRQGAILFLKFAHIDAVSAGPIFVKARAPGKGFGQRQWMSLSRMRRYQTQQDKSRQCNDAE